MFNYSTYCTNCIFTRSVHQPRVYIFGVPITRLCVWYTYKALTNQGVVHQYIDYVVCLNRIDSHHHPNEHTILHVFRAPRYNSLVSLNWYKHYHFNTSRKCLVGSIYSTQQVLKEQYYWQSKVNCRYGVTSTVAERMGLLTYIIVT